MRQKSNGQSTLHRWDYQRGESTSHGQGVTSPRPRRNEFTAEDVNRVGYELCVYAPTYAVGLGTTGAQIVDGLVKRLQRELRSERLPAAFNYLLIDAAAAGLGMDPDHFHPLAGGLNGAGTDPRQGFELFFKTDTYEQLRIAIDAHIVELGRPDSSLPCCLSPREVVDFWIVGGCGGTSGGALQPAITLIHDVARRRNVQHPRINLVMIGAEMPLTDRTRSVTLQQQQVVRATAASALIKLSGDMQNSELLHELRPDGTSFPVAASHRVWSIVFADQSNGQAECSTVTELVNVLVETLFPRLFTTAGIHLGDRFKDFDRLDSTGRGHL